MSQEATKNYTISEKNCLPIRQSWVSARLETHLCTYLPWVLRAQKDGG